MAALLLLCLCSSRPRTDTSPPLSPKSSLDSETRPRYSSRQNSPTRPLARYSSSPCTRILGSSLIENSHYSDSLPRAPSLYAPPSALLGRVTPNRRTSNTTSCSRLSRFRRRSQNYDSYSLLLEIDFENFPPLSTRTWSPCTPSVFLANRASKCTLKTPTFPRRCYLCSWILTPRRRSLIDAPASSTRRRRLLLLLFRTTIKTTRRIKTVSSTRRCNKCRRRTPRRVKSSSRCLSEYFYRSRVR